MSLIYLRQARPADAAASLEILLAAKRFLKASGSTQWQTPGYPSQEIVAADIATGTGMVLMVDDQVAGYAALVVGDEPTYQVIKGGSWQDNDHPYATIHRLSVSDAFRGQHLAKFLFSNLISVGLAKGVRNFRIDTGRKNQIVQHLAESNGFSHRGAIFVDDPADRSRLAYELNL